MSGGGWLTISKSWATARGRFGRVHLSNVVTYVSEWIPTTAAFPDRCLLERRELNVRVRTRRDSLQIWRNGAELVYSEALRFRPLCIEKMSNIGRLA